MILDWIANGTPQGDPADMPDPVVTQSEWPLGAPDVTLSMLQSYTPPRGKDVYRCFVIPTGLNDTSYLSAIDIIPGARQIVHHVLLYQDTAGVGDALTAKMTTGSRDIRASGDPGSH